VHSAGLALKEHGRGHPAAVLSCLKRARPAGSRMFRIFGPTFFFVRGARDVKEEEEDDEEEEKEEERTENVCCLLLISSLI